MDTVYVVLWDFFGDVRISLATTNVKNAINKCMQSSDYYLEIWENDIKIKGPIHGGNEEFGTYLTILENLHDDSVYSDLIMSLNKLKIQYGKEQENNRISKMKIDEEKERATLKKLKKKYES